MLLWLYSSLSGPLNINLWVLEIQYDARNVNFRPFLARIVSLRPVLLAEHIYKLLLGFIPYDMLHEDYIRYSKAI